MPAARQPIPTPTPAASSTWLGAWSGAIFAALSAARGRRIFHPDGVSFTATFTSSFFDVDDMPAIVRVSRAFGLPAALPDIPGLAIKIPDLHGRGRDQDFLLVAVLDRPLLRLLPRLGWGMIGDVYSTLLPYRLLSGAHVVIGARRIGERATLAGAPGHLRFELTMAHPRRRAARIGTLQIERRLAPATGEALCFNPWNTGALLRPAGLLNALRDRAYQGSQRARLRTVRRPVAVRPAA